MKVALIHNHGAGNTAQADGDRLVKLVKSAGHEVIYQSLKKSNWDAVLEIPVDLAVAAGGDGTVGEVARSLITRQIPAAVLPTGTANNVARTLGVAGLSLEQIIAGWRDGHKVRFDVARAVGSSASTVFVEAFGIGVFGCFMAELDAQDNYQLAHLETPAEKIAHARKKIRNRIPKYAAKHLKVTLDGQDISDEYILIEAMNIKDIGPNLHLAPKADPTDGVLDVVLVPSRDRERLSEYLLNCLEGKPPTPLTIRKGERLQIEWDGLDSHIDDELWPSHPTPTRIDVRVDRQVLEFLVPAAGESK